MKTKIGKAELLALANEELAQHPSFRDGMAFDDVEEIAGALHFGISGAMDTFHEVEGIVVRLGQKYALV